MKTVKSHTAPDVLYETDLTLVPVAENRVSVHIHEIRKYEKGAPVQKLKFEQLDPLELTVIKADIRKAATDVNS